MICPSCKRDAAVGYGLFKCDVCGEVRCGRHDCTGGTGKKNQACSGNRCLACGKGKYKKIS